MERVQATFKVESWDEHAIATYDGEKKVVRASVRKTYAGGIEGTATLEYLMVYVDDGSAAFVGMELVVGRLAQLEGRFVLRHVGRYEDGEANATLIVVPGSGAGELTGLRGQGSFQLRHAQEYDLDMEFELPVR
jgi:hypothetical protein